MSALIIPAKKLGVVVKSAWAEHLDWFTQNSPKGNPNEIVNSAVGKVKHEEINRATNNMKLFSENKISSAPELQEYYKTNGRPDGWQVTEVKGKPYTIDGVGYSPDTEQHWTDLLGQEGYVTRDYDHGELTIDNINSYIQRQQLQVNDAAAARDEIREGVHMEYIEEAEELKASIQMQDVVRAHNTYNFDNLHREWEDVMGFDDNEAVDVERIDTALDRLYNRQAEVGDFLEERWDPDYSEELEKLRDSSENLEDLKLRLIDFNSSDPRAMRDRLNRLIDTFGVRWDGPVELENVDDYVEAIKTQLDDGTLEFGTAENFEELLDLQTDIHNLSRTTVETIDLTRTTQEFVDNAGEEFARIANERNWRPPDVDNPESVARFLMDVKAVERDPDKIEHLDKLQQSYDNLRVHVEAGDETITIPNYNTRQVQSNVRYDFEADAFREATLPDTDDATYAIKAYNDPTVDRKGYNRDVHNWGGIFFTRTDSPKAGVHRIQEVQSDISNSMAGNRAKAINEWKEGPVAADMTFDVVGLKGPGGTSRYNTNSPEIIKLRNKTNNKVIEEINNEIGFNIAIKDNYSLTNVRDTLVHQLWPDKAIGKGYSDETVQFLSELRANYNNQYLEASTEVVEEIANRINRTMPQVRDLIDETKNLDSIYKKHLARERGEMILERQDATKYRVTPEERKARIIGGRGISKEEGELNANAVVETLSELSEKYGVDLQPYKGAKRHEDFKDIIKEADDIIHIEDKINLIAEANTLFNKKIDDGMKELKPLEKFPDANKFRLDFDWQKQALQEEIVHAIKNGQTEVWLTSKPDGVGYIGRGNRPQKQYEKGGIWYNKFKSLAKRFKGEIVEEDGYLKMKLPTGKKVAKVTGGSGVLTVPAFANTDMEDERELALANGITPAEYEAYRAENPKTDTDEAARKEDAIAHGVTPEEIDAYYQEAFENKIRGMDPADFATHEGPRSDDRAAPLASQYDLMRDDISRGRGLSYKTLTPDTIKDIAIELEVDPSTPSGIDAIYQEAYWKDNPEEYAEFQAEIDSERLSLNEITGQVADYVNLRDNWKIFSFMAKGFGNNMAAAWRADQDQKLTEFVVKKGAENGLELQKGQGQKIGNQTLATDEWYVKLPHPETGELLWWPATPSTMQSIAGEKYMDVGGLMGAMYGAQKAQKMTRWINGVPHPAAKYVQWGVIGGWTMVGAVTGSLADQLEVDIRQEEDFNWKTTVDRAIGAAELSIVGDAIGIGVGVLGGGLAKQLIKGYNHLIDGNVEGAFDILNKMTGLSKAEIREVVKKWEHLNNKKAPVLERAWYSPRRYVKTTAKREKEQAIAVIPVTRFGGDEIVKGIANKNPGAGAVIGNDIHDRAIMMGKVTEDLLSVHGKKHTVEELLEAIPRWVEETEANLAQVKQAGNDLTPAGYSAGNKANVLPQFKNKVKTTKYEPGYGFNMKEDYINQLYDGSIPGVEGLSVAKKLEKLRMESDDRSFGGLLDFRDKVQQLYDDPRNPKYTRNQLNGMLESIDQEIEAVSKRMGPGGEQWLENYWGALMDAKEMHELQKTGLYRTLTRKEGSKYYTTGLDEEKVANTLVKFGRSLDGSYQSFVKQLPLEIQPKVEALVMNKLVEKHTFNKGQGFEAIMFPQLAEELGHFEFLWPEAKAVREMAEMFGEVYKNDVRLSIAAKGTITEDAFTSYLTTNPFVRAQFAIASSIFNKASTLAGTSRGDASALVRIATKLLKDPLDPTNVQNALDTAKEDAALTGALKRLSEQAAAEKHAGRVDTKIKVFKDKSGRLSAQNSEGAVETDSIPVHRIAVAEVASKIIKDGTDLTKLSKTDKARLINKGYVVIGMDDGTLIKLN